MTTADGRGAGRPGFFSTNPDRRAVLAALGAVMAAGLPVRAAAPAPRLAAIDWAMLETAIALGHMPVAACELIRFREDVVEPVIPADVVDLGLRGVPNFELLQLTRPDLILTSPYYASYEHRLTPLAPVLSLPFFIPGEAPLPKIATALQVLADRVGDPAAADRAMAASDADLDRSAARLRPFADRPVCLINIGDASHIRVFGGDSLFSNVLDRIGLQNAWTSRTMFSFLAPVPITRLTEVPDARLVIVGDIPPEARRGLSRSVLWRALPPIAQDRLYLLPKVNAFGGLPSALRFARLLGDAFEAGPVRQL